MIRRLALCALLAASRARAGVAQAVVEFRERGSGVGPELLARALAGPHVTVEPSALRYLLPRDSAFHSTVVILGRNAYIDGAVHGDVIVVAGDLYMHPGAHIDGRAIAIGGGVYESALAQAVAGTTAFRDFTYDVAPIPGGWTLIYRPVVERAEHALKWPGIFGLRLPSYDRTNGLSLPFAPLVSGPGTSIQIEPRITYRSQFGAFDPSISATMKANHLSTFQFDAGRETLTNDAWIWSDVVNSAEVFVFGEDTRNYYRADRAQLELASHWESAMGTLAPYVGLRVEQATTARPGAGATGGPWAFGGRHSLTDMLRPNPAIDPGQIRSAFTGARFHWSDQGVVTTGTVDEELGGLRSVCDGGTCWTRFAQTTLDGSIAFPTFLTQSLTLNAHAVLSSHGQIPRQRFAYLGGPGTIPTLGMLDRGGDYLLYFDGRYNIPIDRLTLPFIGAPVLMLREVLGGATTGKIPTLAQAAGARMTLGVVYVEALADPAVRRVHIGLGLTLAR